MTINLDDLKKIQPLFEGWNNSDRALKYGRVYYVAGKMDHQLFRFNCILNSTLDEYSRGDDFLHYPYPHQIIDALGERFYYLNFNPIGKWWTVKLWDKDKNTIAYNESDIDRETTLLKALVWQIEQEEK